MDTLNILCGLSDYNSVSGEECHAFLKDILINEIGIASEAISVDINRNLIVTLGNEGRHIMLDAHFDEIGFIVTYVNDDGFIRIANVGGAYVGSMFGAKLDILCDKPCVGVVVTTPPHLQKEKAESLPDITDIWVDTGLGKAAKKRIKPGDVAVKRRKSACLTETRITGKALDNRAGAAVLLSVIDKLKSKALNKKVSIVFSAQEEVGTRGAGCAAFELAPDEAIVVDVSFANQRGVAKEKCGILGGGPMIGISPILSREMFEKLKSAAENNKIPYNVEVMAGRTGTNSDPISITRNGVKTGLVSVPLRNMHTSSEIVDIRDIENAAELIALYIGE